MQNYTDLSTKLYVIDGPEVHTPVPKEIQEWAAKEAAEFAASEEGRAWVRGIIEASPFNKD